MDLHKILGLPPETPIEIVTPQFERTDGNKIEYFPKTIEEFEALRLRCPDDLLQDIGCLRWQNFEVEQEELQDDEEGYLQPGEVHWLFPGEWFENIPKGLHVVDIFGNEEKFDPETADDDIRFGGLPYGFVRQPVE